jgi:hypothetical protein
MPHKEDNFFEAPMKKLALFLMFLTIFLTPGLTFAEDGKCIEGDCETGKGTLTWSGRNYVGEFKGEFPHGQGTTTRPDGLKYEGAWKDGKFNGHGMLTYPDGKKCEGQFKD